MTQNIIYVNYKGKELTVSKYIETYRIDSLLQYAHKSMEQEENKKLIATKNIRAAVIATTGNPVFNKELKTNIKTIEDNFETYVHFMNNLTGKVVKDLIPEAEYKKLSKNDKNILDLDRKVEVLFDIAFGASVPGSIIITKSRTDKQRIKDITGMNDPDDINELMTHIKSGAYKEESKIYGENGVSFNGSRDLVINMLSNIMKAFPKQKLKSQYIDC